MTLYSIKAARQDYSKEYENFQAMVRNKISEMVILNTLVRLRGLFSLKVDEWPHIETHRNILYPRGIIFAQWLLPCIQFHVDEE